MLGPQNHVVEVKLRRIVCPVVVGALLLATLRASALTLNVGIRSAIPGNDAVRRAAVGGRSALWGRLPVGGDEVGDFAHGIVGERGQSVVEVLVGFNAVEFAGGSERVEHRHAMRGLD
jgi:hypothetical protein